VAPLADPVRELRLGPGRWVLLPSGFLRFWLEGEGTMSPADYLAFERVPAQRGMTIVTRPLGPAGRVMVHPRHVGTGVAVQLLSLATGLERWVAGDRLAEPVQMPAGEAVALLREGQQRRCVAVSRPVRVRPGQTVTLDPLPPPPPGTDLVLRLEKFGKPFLTDRPGEFAFLDGAGELRPPAALVVDSATLLAIWYDLPGRRGTLVASPTGFTSATAEVTLAAGAVEEVNLQVRPLPRLEVGLEVPPEWAEGELQLEVLLEGRPVARQPVTDLLAPTVFEEVPAERLLLRLSAPPWEIWGEADATSEPEVRAILAARPVRLYGKVSRCGRPAAAEVSFRTGADRWVSFPLDEQGRYEGVVFTPVQVARLALPGAGEWIELLARPVLADREQNFILPCNAFTVQVREAGSGQAVPAATVGVTSAAGGGGPGFGVSVLTDEEGVAALPPLRPGTLRLAVSAEGYDSATVERQVLSTDREVRLDVQLRRRAPGCPALLLLPDGRPAAGAEVAAFAAAAEALLWQGQADGAGQLELPPLPGAWGLARHGHAGATPFPWPTGPCREVLQVPLHPRGPLRRARVVGTEGRPLPWARVLLWLAGQRCGAVATQWLLGQPGADGEGRVAAEGLPPGGVDLLAWLPEESLDRRGFAGELDARRTAWAPLPATVAIVGVER